MKVINFKKLSIQNFKRIENLDIELGNETHIKGRNGAGKTTIADAIMFVLFNKDLAGNSPTKAGIKRIDSTGNEIPNLQMLVQLTVEVDGVPIIFERKQVEKWTKPRGMNELVFGGNVQELSVNESTVKTAEYESAVAEIIDEDLFKLLTNPHYFMGITEKDRRAMLMDFIGDKDDEIESELKSRDKYGPMVAEWELPINQGKTFPTFVEWLNKKAKTDKEELKSIPEKIQALQKAIGDPIDVDKLKLLIKGYNAEIDKIDEQLNKPVETPKWVAENMTKANELKQKANELNRKAYDEATKEVADELKAKQQIEYKLAQSEGRYTLAVNDKTVAEKNLSEATARREELLKQWADIQAEKYVKPEIDTHCDSCGQALPEDQIESHLAEHKEKWEASKQRRLDAIIEDGNFEKNRIDQSRIAVDKAESEINKEKIEIEHLRKQLEGFGNVELPEMVDTEEALKMIADSDKLLAKVKEYHETTEPNNNDELISQKASYRMMIDDANRKLGQVDIQEAIKVQIKELEEKEVKLQELKVHYEVLINLAEDFLNDKNRAFEDELSKHFTHIKWQLFAPQINGGFKQVCEPLYDGRNWTQQSLGEQIFTGVDIIKAFAEKTEVQAPIIIDNRESLTLDLNLDSQTISMYADDTVEGLSIV